MDAQEFQIRAFAQRIGHFLQLPYIYAEFIFVEPGGDKVMRVGINIRVDADGNFTKIQGSKKALSDITSVRHRMPGEVIQGPKSQEHQPRKKERGKRHDKINHLALGNQMHEVASDQGSFANRD